MKRLLKLLSQHPVIASLALTALMITGIAVAQTQWSGAQTFSGAVTVNSLTVQSNAISAAPSLTGIYLSGAAQTLTDNSTAGSGTATASAVMGFAQPTIKATNTSVTTTIAPYLYFAGPPIGGTNQTLTTAATLMLDSGACANTTNCVNAYFKNPTAGSTSNVALQTQAGTSTGVVIPSGQTQMTTTSVGNAGSCASAQTLISYTLPANALSATNKGVRVTQYGTTANNATAKTIQIAWGAQTIGPKALVASVAGTWKTVLTCWKTGASTQTCDGELWNDPGSSVAAADGAGVLLQKIRLAGTQTDTAPIAVSTQCITNANAASDIVGQVQLVEFFN